MKRLVLISLLAAAVGVMAFLGCERPEPIDPTEGQPQTEAEDSLINQQGDTNTNQQPDNIVVEHWKAVRPNGYYNYNDCTYHEETYTYAYMDIYPNDSTIYTVDIDSTDRIGLFANGYSSYSMNGDTITVEVTSSFEYPECQRRWLVVRPNDTTMNWQFLGWEWQVGVSTNSHMFYLIGVER